MFAESLYRGQQHLRLLGGVREYKRAKQPAGRLELRIVSAGHGVVPPSRKLEPYESTFSGLPREATRRRARRLGIPDQVERLLTQPYDLAVVLLGDLYLEACELRPTIELGGPTLAFCSPRSALRLPLLAGLRPIALRNSEARRFSCGLVSLKGELGGRLLRALAGEPALAGRVADPDFDLFELMDEMADAAELATEA